MKKTKFMTKVMAVVFALAILFAMSVPAWAVDTTTNQAGVGHANNPNIIEYTESDASTKTYTMKKTVVVFNTEANSTVYEPAITFYYAATAGAAGASVTDGTNTVKTLAGVNPDQITFTNAVYRNSTQVTGVAVNGTAVEKDVTISVPDSAFSVAGIYRYVITETTSTNNVEDVGLTARTTNYKTTRYMDVYVSNKSTSGVYVSAIVLFQSANGSGSDNINDSYVKTSGFTDNTVNGNYTNDDSVDRYQTYNLVVSKKIEGALAQKNHKFPFTVTLGNTNNMLAGYTVTPSVSASTATLYSSTTTADGLYSASLADGGYLKIVGIPNGTTVQVHEQNDTVDSYVPSINTDTTVAGLALTVTTALNPNATTELTAATVPTINDATQNTVISYTNTIENISPTGLAFRVAPYILMLAAGVSLIVLFAKRRREVTDMI